MKYSDAQVKDAIAEAQKSIKQFTEFFEGGNVNPLSLAQDGEMWEFLTSSQKAMVEKAFDGS